MLIGSGHDLETDQDLGPDQCHQHQEELGWESSDQHREGFCWVKRVPDSCHDGDLETDLSLVQIHECSLGQDGEDLRQNQRIDHLRHQTCGFFPWHGRAQSSFWTSHFQA